MTTELKPPTREQVLKAMRDCPQARAALLAMYPDVMHKSPESLLEEATKLLGRTLYWIDRLIELEPDRGGTEGARELRRDIEIFGHSPQVVALLEQSG